MLSMGKMKPESRIEGRMVVRNPISHATWDVFEIAEMNRPVPRADPRKTNDKKRNSTMLPRKGTPKKYLPEITISMRSMKTISI
jgi:hypothetical protein